MKKTFNQHPKGVALLILVLVLGTVGIIAFAILSRISIEEIVSVHTHIQSTDTRNNLMGCVDEVLIQLQADSTFAPVVVTTGDVTCDLSISTPVDGQRDIVIFLTEGNISRSTQLRVTLDPFTVDEMTE